ncbi:NAD(P) transhydrogenase subunit alpha part 1 [Candidatus Defluviicoccus seviourii]|uniref:NAD(P) transhydrogenase subunit alpha part 1 n=1 Tax=Candidatus Defluviicoccus seviourii TaxID=2565273 RepID=A0A564WCG7_9PROT|nr:NAD(P) transhydrogenase subunit alpha part 1 [Candidatus Defluviicoccus seviourii]
MKIAIPRERMPGETRVAATPDIVKKYVGLGFEVIVETGAGETSAMTDAEYQAAGASIGGNEQETLGQADVVLKVQRPLLNGDANELALLKPGTVLVAQLAALTHRDEVEAYAKAGVTAFALELMPRISRAQSMDILSSQNNLAGYKAVIDGAAEYGSALPMMMTAAGTVPPAKVFIMGVGVAGLQAIATAKRLGAVVTANDVRPATKEQVESLGGKFIMVDETAMKSAETAGGYAKEMSDEYKKKAAEVVAEHVKKQDIVITTALIPGKPAPKLISEEMVKSMKPGSVIIDLAAETGGNCALTEPGKVVVKHGVRIVGHLNVPGRLPKDASALFARNVLNFLTPHVDKESKSLKFNWEDETVRDTVVCRDGQVVSPLLQGEAK